MGAFLLAGPAFAASDAVKCVQLELAELGYDPGTPHGNLNKQTLAASEVYRADMKRRDPNWGQPGLEENNADFWCDKVSGAFPKVRYLYDAYRGVGKVEPKAAETDESGFIFEVAKDVPAKRLAEIREGFEIAQAYMDKALGGALAPDVIARILVKVVATGKGNPDAGGAVATAGDVPGSGGQPMIFFDVGHRDWNQNAKSRGWSTATDNVKVVVHEYTHVWHRLLGSGGSGRFNLSSWFNEGIAEYVAYNAMADLGRLKLKDVMTFMAGDGRGEEFEHTFAEYDRGVSTWPGHVAYVAIDWLVSSSPNGRLSIRILADELKAGRPIPQAFRTAFGLEQRDFYEQFEAFKKALRKSPRKALANREPLQLAVTEADTPIVPPVSDEAQELFHKGYVADSGDGGPKDDAAAIKWYALAAEAGSPEAMRNLAGMLGAGRGAKRDEAASAKWFKAAAEAGDAQGQFGYASWILTDPKEKIVWLRKAAAQEHAEAIKLLTAMKVSLKDEAEVAAAAKPERRPLAADDLAKCIQAGLNGAGFPVGAVDGRIGNGTRKVFEAFAKAKLPGFVRLRDENYTAICLFMARHYDIGSDYEAVADQLLAETEVMLNIEIPEDAGFLVRFLKDKQVVIDVADFDWVPFGRGYVHRAALPLANVAQADTICVWFTNGWMVKDQAGELYKGSCDPLEPAFLSLPGLSRTYFVEKPAP